MVRAQRRGPRVAVGGVWYETNTFAPGATTLEAFEVHAAEANLSAFGGTRTPIGGSLDDAQQHGLRVVPTVFAWAVPSGIVDGSAYETLAERFVDASG